MKYVDRIVAGDSQDSVTGGDIRLEGHGCGVSMGTPGSRLPVRHYAICI